MRNISLWTERWFLSSNAKDILRRCGRYHCMNLMNQIGSKKPLKMYYLVMTVTRIIRAVNSPGRFKPIHVGSVQNRHSLFRLAMSNEISLRVLMEDSHAAFVSYIFKKNKKGCRLACWAYKSVSRAWAKLCYKIGPLAVGEGTPIPTRNNPAGHFDIKWTGTLWLSIPIQETSHWFACYVSAIAKHKIAQGWNFLKAGTPVNGQHCPLGAIITWLLNCARTYICQSSKKSDYVSQDGGKITEEANAGVTILISDPPFLFYLGRSLTSALALMLVASLGKDHERPLQRASWIQYCYRRRISHSGTNTGWGYTRERRNYTTSRIAKQSKRASYYKKKWTADWKAIERKVHEDQMNLVKLAQTNGGTKGRDVLKRQRMLALNLKFRMLAVQRAVTNSGGKTPGVDGETLSTDQQKWEMVEKLKSYIMKPEGYQAQPVRRVYLLRYAQSNGKIRPEGCIAVPTITDRCLQALVNLVLEPLVEMNSDKHSYGFRKYRSAKMAIGVLLRNRNNLVPVAEQQYDKFVLDADIKGFFDSISHEWLLSHVPLERTLNLILKGWLKAGSIYKDQVVEYGQIQAGNLIGGSSDACLTKRVRVMRSSPLIPVPLNVKGVALQNLKVGVSNSGPLVMRRNPQVWVGHISPTLANFTLNGLESSLEQAVQREYKVRKRGIYIGKVTRPGDENGKYGYLSTHLSTIRYASSFIVLARSRRMIEATILPQLENFLSERGLSASKLKVLCMQSLQLSSSPATLDFLGYSFSLRPNNRKFLAGLPISLSCYPQKQKYQALVSHLKAIISKSRNQSAYTLITQLNPLIQSWSQYYHLSLHSPSSSSNLRTRLHAELLRLTYAWARGKHPRWGKTKIAQIYFIKNQKIEKTLGDIDYTTGNDNKWVFTGYTKSESIYTESEGGKIIELLNPTKVVSTLSAARYRIPERLELVHAYHEKYEELIDFNYAMSKQAMKDNTSFKAKLFIKQKGRCGICGSSLLDDHGEFNYDGSNHIHGIKPRSKKGAKNQIKMMLVHSEHSALLSP